MTILEQLKFETADLHRIVESTSVNRDILSDSFSPDQYEELILRNYCIHKALEKEIENFLNTFAGSLSTSSLAAFYQPKSHWLLEDLKMLNLDFQSSLSDSVSPPHIDSISRMIGCLYVIEGSMLGGRMIYKVFQKKESLADIPEFRFFKGNEKEQGNRWRSFQQIALTETNHPNEAILAAKETFSFFRLVFDLKTI